MFFGAIAPDWRNLIPGYGVYHTIKGFVEWLGASHHNPAPYFSVGASSIEDGRIPIGAIGWTQRTISSRVFNITINDYVHFEQVVRRALGIYYTTWASVKLTQPVGDLQAFAAVSCGNAFESCYEGGGWEDFGDED
ncbi:hypothetical protein ONZ45_g11932 [Pleurotus djamor]|nr:hypothetical protein ONZ45_g11932 [Pleurotus djamor]